MIEEPVTCRFAPRPLLSFLLFRWELSWATPNLQKPLRVGGTSLAAFPPANNQEEGLTMMVGANGGHLLKCQVGKMDLRREADQRQEGGLGGDALTGGRCASFWLVVGKGLLLLTAARGLQKWCYLS